MGCVDAAGWDAWTPRGEEDILAFTNGYEELVGGRPGAEEEEEGGGG